MRLGMDATRISDGKPVMLKKLLREEGPHELEINKLFSAEPLASDPRNHCVRLLDVIELPNDPPIIVHPLLRPFANPPLQTYGEFVTFFSHTCEVSPLIPRVESCSCPTDTQGVQFMHENHVAHRYAVITLAFPFLIWPTQGTVRTRISCLTHRICSPSLYTLP